MNNECINISLFNCLRIINDVPRKRQVLNIKIQVLHWQAAMKKTLVLLSKQFSFVHKYSFDLARLSDPLVEQGMFVPWENEFVVKRSCLFLSLLTMPLCAALSSALMVCVLSKFQNKRNRHSKLFFVSRFQNWSRVMRRFFFVKRVWNISRKRSKLLSEHITVVFLNFANQLATGTVQANALKSLDRTAGHGGTKRHSVNSSSFPSASAISRTCPAWKWCTKTTGLRSTGQQPRTKSASCPGGELRMNRSSTALQLLVNR